MRSCGILISLAFFVLFFAGELYAGNCFDATKGSVKENAQSIRLKAENLGFSVFKPISITTATVVKANIDLYPKSKVEVCLRSIEGKLQIRIQAKSKDAGKADWLWLAARRNAAKGR